jgi:hypothetical protein
MPFSKAEIDYMRRVERDLTFSAEDIRNSARIGLEFYQRANPHLALILDHDAVESLVARFEGTESNNAGMIALTNAVKDEFERLAHFEPIEDEL